MGHMAYLGKYDNYAMQRSHTSYAQLAVDLRVFWRVFVVVFFAEWTQVRALREAE